MVHGAGEGGKKDCPVSYFHCPRCSGSIHTCALRREYSDSRLWYAFMDLCIRYLTCNSCHISFGFYEEKSSMRRKFPIYFFYCLILFFHSSLITHHSSLSYASEETPFEEFPIPTPMSSPTDIAIDRSDIVWVMEYTANKIGRFDHSLNIFEEFEITTAKSEATDMTIDKDDNLWFTEQEGNQVGKFNTRTLKFEEFALPVPNSNPASITVDLKGNVWFVEWNRNKITKFTPPPHSPPFQKGGKGGFTAYDIPTPMSQSLGLVPDSKDNIWFVEKGGNKLGVLNHETGKIKEYEIKPAMTMPIGTVIDSKGNVWFCKLKDKKLVRFDSSTGEFKDFSLPGKKGVQSMAIDKGNNIWLALRYENKIVRFDQDSEIFTEYDTAKDSQPLAMSEDSKGNIWFTMIKGNKIGKLDMSQIGSISRKSDLKVKLKPPEEMIRK